MRPISLTCAAGLALAALAISGSAKASPYHLIRWEGTGFCQVWDNGIATKPWPSNYRVVTHGMSSFGTALRVKDHMLKHGHCTF